MTLGEDIALAGVAVTAIVGWGSYQYYLLSQKLSKPQLSFEFYQGEGEVDAKETYLYYVARNVGQLSIHMEWFGFRVMGKQIVFHDYFMSDSFELVPYILPLKPRKRGEILPGRAYESSVDVTIITTFFREAKFIGRVQLVPCLGDERGNVYTGKPYSLILTQK